MLISRSLPHPLYLLEFEQNVRNTATLYIQNIQLETKRREISLSLLKQKSILMILKQVVGIDVAQKELVVSVGRLRHDLVAEIFANKTFQNSSKGLSDLLTWAKKLTDQEVRVHFVMEATGVYHESLAYFLDNHSEQVSILSPNKISNYFKTLEVKTLTDKSASEAIARFGLERQLELWRKPKKIFKNLKQLTRETDQIVNERTIVKNHLHAELAEAQPNSSSITRIRKRIALLDKQEKEIKKEINSLIKSDDQLNHTVDVLTSIPGIGSLTAAIVLAETNGFELIRNKLNLQAMPVWMCAKRNQEHQLMENQKSQKREIDIYERPCIFQLSFPLDLMNRLKILLQDWLKNTA
jgi:transposase